ncbi:PREDICTED: gasdermin-B-like [Elephantulus edwardii]|uniref:gasdermin-B-like n=1 Tax=Elephantulus edwardii TaxID=28737 RepID=UPI0003F062C1|nr:PREDICTED: gasdermin-B-like [Elephantulus edwardii]
MPSIFEEITRTVIQKLDSRGDMIAVKSATNADSFHCYCLVREKRTILGIQYYKTALTLKDILEREAGERPINEVDSMSSDQKTEFPILNDVDTKGELTLELPKAITTAGMAENSQGTQKQEIRILVNQIPQQHLDSLVDRKLKRKLPPTFETIHARRENLYLVTETLVTANEETLRRERQFKLKTWMNGWIPSFEHKVRISQSNDGGEPALAHLLQHQKTVTIPSQWVLGYRIKQLIFSSMDRMSICLSGNTKSFPEENDGSSSVIGKSSSLEDLRSIKEKVQDLRSGLQDLTEKDRKDLLSCLTKVLNNDGILQHLEERVSEALISGELPLGDPAGPLINCLFNDDGILVEERLEAVQELLYSLTALSEDDQQLVHEALEEGMLPLLMKQVENALEKNWNEYNNNPPDTGCDAEAQSLCAFYVVLSILLQLDDKANSATS